jgi:ketosteroid isomerase-like protein
VIDREHVSRWLADYIAAWKSYDRDQIGDLFSEDVVYLFHPYDEPLRGREAVVTAWLGESDHEGASERDEPGTYEATYEPVAVDGDLAVVTGESVYTHPDGSFEEAYDNCFLIRFAADGRCREFTEYYVKRPPG